MGLISWLNKKENSNDLFIATFLLFDIVLINWLFSFFTSYLNHPTYYFSDFEKWIIIPLGVLIIPVLLIILIIFQIRLTRERYATKIINNYFKHN